MIGTVLAFLAFHEDVASTLLVGALVGSLHASRRAAEALGTARVTAARAHAELVAERRAHEDRVRVLEADGERLADRFRSVAADALAQGCEHVPEGAAREAIRQHAAILAAGGVVGYKANRAIQAAGGFAGGGLAGLSRGHMIGGAVVAGLLGAQLLGGLAALNKPADQK